MTPFLLLQGTTHTRSEILRPTKRNLQKRLMARLQPLLDLISLIRVAFLRYAPRNPKENAAYRPPAVEWRQKSLQSFLLQVCQTKPLRTASVSSIRQTIRASLSLQVILFFQISGRGSPYQEVVPQYVIGCMKHLKSLSIRGEEIPSFAAHIKDYRIVDSPSSSLEKVNSNSLFCTTHGFHCLHLGLKSFPSADCMQSQLTGSSHRSSNY